MLIAVNTWVTGCLDMCVDEDSTDIANQTRLLYARTNFLIRRFSACSRDVKIRLFKTYCVHFYGIAVWKHYSVTVMHKLQAAYNKCIKLFFGYGGDIA